MRYDKKLTDDMVDDMVNIVQEIANKHNLPAYAAGGGVVMSFSDFMINQAENTGQNDEAFYNVMMGVKKHLRKFVEVNYA